MKAKLDAGRRAGDLARHEGFTPAGAFVIEEDAVGDEHSIAFPMVHALVMAVDLGAGIGRAWLKTGAFVLPRFGRTEHLTGTGLVDPNLPARGFLMAPDRLQQPEGPQAHHICREFGLVEADPHMALGTEVIDLIRLVFVEDAPQAATIRQVAVVKVEVGMLVRVFINVINAVCVEVGRATHDAMDLIALPKQELGEVAAILASDAGDQCGAGLAHGVHPG